MSDFNARPIADRSSGTSLVELLVVLAAMLVVSSAIFGAVILSQGIYVSEEDTVLSQQEGRAALLLLSNAVRLAGCGLPVNHGDPGGGGENVPFSFATETEVHLSGCTSDPPVRASVTTDTDVGSFPATVVLPVDTVTGFQVSNRVFVYSRSHWAHGVIGSIDTGAGTLSVTVDAGSPAPFTLVPGSFLHREERTEFAFDATSGVLSRKISIAPATATFEPLLENVTDLQFSFIDESGAALTSFPLSLPDRRAARGMEVILSFQTEHESPHVTRRNFTVSASVRPRNLSWE